MVYKKERDFIIAVMRDAFDKYCGLSLNTAQKSAFDLVTDIDLNIEKFIAEAIRKEYPADIIHGEEFSSAAGITGRAWTVDPIDGTCNMANGSKLFGMQCALIDDGEIVMGAVYLPHFDETICASKGDGCYFNGKKITVDSGGTLNNAIVSFGDYSHADDDCGEIEHAAIKKLYPQVAKIRMFGAACLDFSFVAQGRTHGTALMTKNLWDIAPGIVICREAGAIVTNLKGNPYRIGDEGVVAAASVQLNRLICDSFAGKLTFGSGIEPICFDACIFDFDGVIADTEKFHYAAWKRAFSEYGVELTEAEYLPLRSTGKANIIAFGERKRGKAFTAEQKSKIAEIKKSEFLKATSGVTDADMIKGAREFVTRVNRACVKTAVASSAQTAGSMIEKLGIKNAFDVVIDGNADLPKKPSPDIYFAAMSELGVAPQKCLVFEDSAAGIEAGLASGASVIAIGGIKDDRALMCVDDFTALLNMSVADER